MGNLIEFRCGLIDFQVGRDHGKLNFDPSVYIEQCAKSGMKRIMFTCKDAYGDAYYTSDLVEQNPMAGNDYLSSAVSKAHELDLELYAYYNVFLDDIYASAHPEHRMIDSEGNPVISYDYYKSLCPNSPYSDVVRERIADLVFNYDVDGVFLDITYFRGGTCFCDSCKTAFKEAYGYELKNNVGPGTQEFADFLEFRRTSRAKILISICDTVKEIKNIPVIWNGSGSIYLAEPETDSFSDYLTTEFHAPDYLDGIIRAKWMQSRDKGFIMSTPSELGSWGDWTMVPEITLKSVVCSIAAHGGGVYYNHTPYPSGPFAKSYIPPLSENISKAFKYLESFEESLRDTKSCSDTAILLSIESKRFWENGFGAEGFEFFKSLKGAVKILLASGKPFDIIDESKLIEGCSYKTIIIPGVPYAGEETLDSLEAYIKEGGNVLVSGEFACLDETGKRKEQLPEFIGCRHAGYSEISVEYISGLDNSIKNSIPDMPVLIKKAGKLPDIIANESSDILAMKCKPPFEAEIDRHVYHQHAHPYEITEFAGVLQNKYGQGTVIFIPSDIFRSFYETGSPWLMMLAQNCLGVFDDNPLLVINAPECAYPTVLESDNGYLLQLININGPITEPTKVFPTTMLKIPVINIRTAIEFKNARLIASDKETILEKNGRELILKNVGLHTAIFLEK
jgi:hypothetical protein